MFFDQLFFVFYTKPCYNDTCRLVMIFCYRSWSIYLSENKTQYCGKKNKTKTKNCYIYTTFRIILYVEPVNNPGAFLFYVFFFSYISLPRIHYERELRKNLISSHCAQQPLQQQRWLREFACLANNVISTESDLIPWACALYKLFFRYLINYLSSRCTGV